MLQGFSSKNGTGITIYGDYCDLYSLYLTISKISENDCQTDDDPLYIILMCFLYEVSKAYSEQRLKEEITFERVRKIEYFGFQYLWTDLLIFINTLRYQAAYTTTDALDQANLFLLDHISKKALEEYDSEGASQLKKLIGKRINIHDPLLLQINEFINIEYLKLKPGKKRFRKLYAMITNYFSPWTEEGKNLKMRLEERAKELGTTTNKTGFDQENLGEILW